MKKLFLFLFFGSMLFAQESDNIIRGSAGGEEIVTENRMQRDLTPQQEEYYKEEAIFSWILWAKSQSRPSGIPQTAKLVNLVAESNVSAAGAINQTTKNTTIVRGYCIISEDVHINKQPSSLALACNTNIGAIDIFGNLQPVNEAAALIYQPFYIDFNGYRHKISKFTTTNEARTSYNIATFVNDRKLSELGYSVLVVSTDEISKTTSEYLEQLEESKKKESVDYAAVSNSSYIQPIQTTNTEKPDIVTYATTAAINIVASAIKTGADIFKRDLPYLYEIIGGSKIYIDLEIENKGEKI